MSSDPREGFVVWCDNEGHIMAVLKRSPAVGSDEQTGRPLCSLLDSDSHDKCRRFLAALRDQPRVAGWEMNVRLHEVIVGMVFCAAREDRATLVVAASVHRQDAEQLLGMHAEDRDRRSSDGSTGGYHSADIDGEAYERLTEITNELSHTQRSLQKKNHELRRLNEEKNRVLGMAAHDLRNPLGSFHGLANLILDEYGDSDEMLREYMLEMRRSAAYMLRLVNDLLDVSKVESGHIEIDAEPTGMVALARTTITMRQAGARKANVGLQLLPEQEPVVATVDPHKLLQVLDNLISNAVKFSPTGATVRIRLAASGTTCRVAVEDDGPGIPAEEHQKLFRPFARASTSAARKEKSTGLGLVICRRIVEAHGGQIGVTSAPGAGSVFWFELPLNR
jgi:signal transduction histidine kinase